MIYTKFVSASINHILWLKGSIKKMAGLSGRISDSAKVLQLRYAKNASLGLYKQMYYDKNVVCLSRKKTKFENFIKQAGVL